MLFLDALHGGIGADQAGLQGASVFGGGMNLRKIRLRGAVHHLVTRVLHKLGNIIQILAGWQAAMVAHAPEGHANIRIAIDGGFALNFRQSRSVAAAIDGFILHPGSLDAAAILSHPDKLPGGQRQHLGHGAAEQVGIKAAFFQNLHQAH